jgi:diketogulonate reductase-like aldo/keto reductase
MDLLRLGVVPDLLLLHHPCAAAEDTAMAYRALERALSAKLTRSIGVSNLNLTQLAGLLSASSVLPAVNQAKLHVGYHDDSTILFCQVHQITYQAYSPLGGELLLAASSTNPTLRGSRCLKPCCATGYPADAGSMLRIPPVKAIAQVSS